MDRLFLGSLLIDKTRLDRSSGLLFLLAPTFSLLLGLSLFCDLSLSFGKTVLIPGHALSSLLVLNGRAYCHGRHRLHSPSSDFRARKDDPSFGAENTAIDVAGQPVGRAKEMNERHSHRCGAAYSFDEPAEGSIAVGPVNVQTITVDQLSQQSSGQRSHGHCFCRKILNSPVSLSSPAPIMSPRGEPRWHAAGQFPTATLHFAVHDVCWGHLK